MLVVRYARRDGRDAIPDALLCLDIATGTERDRTTVADEDVSQPVVADGYLFVPTDERLIAYR